MDTRVAALLTTPSPQLQGSDTVVMMIARDGLQTASVWAIVIVGVFFLMLVPLLAILLMQLRKLNGTVRELGEKGLRRADPLIESGKAVADNVEFVTMAVRTDVQRLNASVKSLTDRLQQASERMEERIEEFNVLMEVVQSEAEDIFIGTAATVRGVRAGARSLDEAGRAQAPATGEEALPRGGAGDDEAGDVYLTRPAQPSTPAARRSGE